MKSGIRSGSARPIGRLRKQEKIEIENSKRKKKKKRKRDGKEKIIVEK